MSIHRPGGHWRVTIVEEGVQPVDDTGHRPDARLRAVVMDGKVLTTDPGLAELVCALLNGEMPPRIVRDIARLLDEYRGAKALRDGIRAVVQQSLADTGRTCCDLHGRHCEYPSELCCSLCTETAHVGITPHADGSQCVLEVKA